MGGEVEYLGRITISWSGLRDGRPSITSDPEGELAPNPFVSNIESRRNATGLRGIFLAGERARLSIDGCGLSTGRILAPVGKSGLVELFLLKRNSLALAPAWIPFKTSSAVGLLSGSTERSLSKKL